jgi:DNA-binding NarL/FixJ family response regulator
LGNALGRAFPHGLLPARPITPEGAARSLRRVGVSVIVADPQPVVRRGLESLLEQVAGISVVAEAATARDALRLAALHRPDVMVVDTKMPGTGGSNLIAEARQCAPGMAVLVFTAADDDESVLAAVRVGACGYLLKSASGDGIVRAIRGLAAGEAVFGPEIAGRLTDLMAHRPPAERAFPELTGREWEVLNLLAAGARNAVIARQLGLSPKTVSNYISIVFGKLRVDSRAEAIILARRSGLGQA